MAKFSNSPPQLPSITQTTTVSSSSSSSISTIPPDILRAHILTRLDGPSLVSISCTSTELNSLASNTELWTNICHSTWPSTDMPPMRHVVSAFPGGPRSFFSRCFPLLSHLSRAIASPHNPIRPSELISAVDVYYCGNIIFSKVDQMETASPWFLCSPFRIDMLDPKDTCPTPIPHPDSEGMSCKDLVDDLSLSWILVDPAGRAMNVSSYKPVSVQRHWLSGEVHARFASVVEGKRGSSSELVHCGTLLTCGGGAQGGGMHVREVSLQVEDLDGMFLNGRESLGILQGAFEGKKGRKGRREQEGRERYEEFLEMKKGRKERRLKAEGTLDMLCVIFGVLIFAYFGFFALLRKN